MPDLASRRDLDCTPSSAVICLPAEEESTKAGTPIGWCQLDRLEERPQHRCGHFGIIIDKAYRVSNLGIFQMPFARELNRLSRAGIWLRDGSGRVASAARLYRIWPEPSGE